MTPRRGLSWTRGGLVVLAMLILPVAVVLVSLRPTVAAAFVVVFAATTIGFAVMAGWHRFSPRHRRLFGMAATLCAVLLLLLPVLFRGSLRYGAPGPAVQVSVPYTATAELTASGWDVREEFRVDGPAVEQIAATAPL